MSFVTDPVRQLRHIIFTAFFAATLFQIVVAGAAVTGSKTLRIGYFLQESQPPYRIGAIKMAIDQAQADGLLPDYNYRCAHNKSSAYYKMRGIKFICVTFK